MSDEGSKLWLRYDPLGRAGERFARAFAQVAVDGTSPTARATRDELPRSLSALFGIPVEAAARGTVLVGTPSTSATVRELNWSKDLDAAGRDGFVIRSADVRGKPTIVIASTTDV